LLDLLANTYLRLHGELSICSWPRWWQTSPHVRRDDSNTGSDRGQRPEHSQIENTDIGTAEDFEEEEVDNRRDSLSVPESYVGYRRTP